MPAPRKKKATPKKKTTQKKPATRKKVARVKKVATVDTFEHTQLEVYSIWLNEYYKSLRDAGFPVDICLSLIMDKSSYPAWVNFEIPKNVDASQYLDEEDED